MKTRYIISVVLFIIFIIPSFAQVEETEEKVKEKVKERVESNVEEGIEEGVNSVEEGIKSIFSKKKKEKKSNEDEDSESTPKEKSIKPDNNKKDFKSYTKFDFIPGDKVIFYDDFSDVEIGDFPQNWDTQASGEVVTVEGVSGKWFKLKGDYSYFAPILKNFKFPENFTIEFDAIFPEEHWMSIEVYEEPSGSLYNGYYPGKGGTNIDFIKEQIIWKTWKQDDENMPTGNATHSGITEGEKVRYSIWGQKSRLRVYCNNEKVIDVPRGIRLDMAMNYIRFGNYPNSYAYISNLRVAAGAPDTRNRLITEGKLVTRGITFDSGSDKIKPESYGVVKEIADVLKENKNVNVKIIGHTDSDGDDASNLTLSQKRAAAVKNMLAKEFSIENSRMTTDGKGESEPLSPNTTTEGKANNRRVEFIKTN